MALGWNEIKERALKFSNEWKDACREEADAKPFLVEFFNVFGISSRKVATFEHKVKKLNEHEGYIDLLWKGTILIEMKSRGISLDKAFQQAMEYIQGLPQYELPRYILVSDFENFRLYDLDDHLETHFQLKDFIDHVTLFGFIAGYQKRIFKEEDAVNIQAAERMGKLHDALKESGYSGHILEKYLVRLLFCLFGDDTTIFEKRAFQDYIETKTAEDGTDLGLHLGYIFQILNTPYDKRLKTLDESLRSFPYVNGHLFEEQLPFASFNTRMRQSLLECCQLDWGKISPAIFGSMFQSVMDEKQRRNLGAHYTSEKNILKLIRPLFLDKLHKEFDEVKENSNKLRQFHKKIASLRFLDPACGCGNFLVITYRELRLIELSILKKQFKNQGLLDLESMMLCNVDRFYGIEYEEFPAQIAQVALWLMDHQMNMMVSQEFGEYVSRLPLIRSAKIVHDNALRIDWQSILEPLPWDIGERREKFDYILGNPPFVGKHLQNRDQKLDMESVFKKVKGSGVLDYVTAWYLIAAQYLQRFNSEELAPENKTVIAFVSTNSIAQGEQVGILWKELFNQYKIKIHFAHRTFKWGNEAKGNAAVHVVIIGFSNFDVNGKSIFFYDEVKSTPQEVLCKNINPYLVSGKDAFLVARSKPISNVPELLYGNKIVDGGYYLFNDNEKNDFIQLEPESIKYFRQILSGDEFLNGNNRWVLYLKDAPLEDIRKLPYVVERINNVREYRLKSSKIQTQEKADTPTLFAEERQPITDFILIPRTSSENRRYIPISVFSSDYIVNDSCTTMPNFKLYHFGILTSLMHMTWMKYTCGRLKSDYRYSNSIVYNNFPWPSDASESQIEFIEQSVKKLLDARLQYPGCSLAELYDPLTIPPVLIKAHQELDKAVDITYRKQPFANETKRIEFLFELYDMYTAGVNKVQEIE